MMLQNKIISEVNYPLKNGERIFSNGSTVTVTKSNHIKFSNITSIGACFLQDISLNKLNAWGSLENCNGQPKIFTLKVGDVCILKLKNIQIYDGILNIAFNLRLSDKNGSSKFSTTIKNEADIDTEVTIQEEQNISGLFCYINSRTATEWEMDVEFYVNGERWI